MAKAAIWTSCAEHRSQVAVLLAAAGFDVTNDHRSITPAAGLASLQLAVVEWDGNAPGGGVELVRELRRVNDSARLVILASNGSEDLAVEALRARADDYIKVPFEVAELNRALSRCSLAARRGCSDYDGMAGDSDYMRDLRDYLGKIACTESNVLVTGETGTGKEKVAQAIHRMSRRSAHPFVCVNCAAIPDALLESELFGYEKGAFTGAVGSRDGKLKLAQRGTVFFDEIGDMSLAAQTKILRAIESREIYPLGSGRAIPLDVRVIAATNRDLSIMMREERFRSDLYFRLNVGRIHLIPLRERISDLTSIANSFLPHFNRIFGSRVESLSDGVMRDLMNYSWPGNIRELRNVIEIMFVHLPAGSLQLTSLPEQVVNAWRNEEKTEPDERERLIAALTSTEWNISKAARKLHWSRMTMYRKLAKYDVSRGGGVTEHGRGATA